jgi:UV DNA damage endonuclease
MSFNSNIQRIGFACKWAEINKKGEIVSEESTKTGGTTHAWAKRQSSRSTVETKLIESAKRNITNTHNLVKRVAQLEPGLRMVRLTSDMLTFYTLDEYKDFWQTNEVRNMLERWFAPIGETARANDVRLSFHPDQFVVLASDRPEVVNKSIEEFEYHVDMARYMGYGKQFQDIKINVHISGKQGPAGIICALDRLTPEARNTITIENEEISWGLDSTLELSGHLGLVLDVHHHWVKTGEYIQPNDDRIKRVIDSWRGVRPAMHFSTSREDGVIDRNTTERHDLNLLLESGYNKQKLRAHSDYFYNDAMNRWAHGHWSWADIMCESKAKNLASFKLYDTYKTYV